jgi:peptidoglycan hydrolase-like protein with peptidoglycan-binding domain
MSRSNIMKRIVTIVAFTAGFFALLTLAASAHPRQSGASASASTSAPKPVSAKKRKHHYLRRQPSQKAPTADRISEIQSALARDGYYQGDPNGKWDAGTVSAMQRFQSQHGLDANGKIDALTLQKLGLGSDIAGVSAPRPITPGSTASPATATPPAPKTQPSSSSTGSNATSASLSKPQH